MNFDQTGNGKAKIIQALMACAVHTPAKPRSLSRIKRRESDFWQRRFWEHQIRDEREFERCADYIHYRLVKNKLIKTAKYWPYSTFHRYVRLGVHHENWGNDPGSGCTRIGNRTKSSSTLGWGEVRTPTFHFVAR